MENREKLVYEAHVRFLEDIIYRLVTGEKELSTGMYMELMRIIASKNKDNQDIS